MKSAMLQMDGYLQAGNIPQNLAAIQEIFGFGTPIKSVADVLVVAIDIENVGWKGQIPPYFQIGLCVLDTRHLMSYSSTFNETDAVIVSHSFCVGPEKYRATVSNQFRFGETKMIRRAEVSATIENIMSGRDYALVFHDRKEDIRFLEAMQVGLNPTYFIDTQQAAKEVLGVHHNTNLRTLVEIVQCPKVKFHNAGNDANLTLRALMALAARRSFKHCSVSPEKESIREALSYFARAPVALKETSTENQQRIYRLNAEDPGQQEDEEEQFLGSRETSEQEREVEDEKEKEKEDWIKVLNEHQVQKREKRLEKQARKTERRKWKKKRDMKRGNRQLGMRSSCTAINSGACLHNADHTLSENK